MSYVIATSRSWNEALASDLAEKTGEPFHLITKVEDLTVERLELLNPRYVFFPHWSQVIPKTIHQKFECVVFHITDLPYGRGGSPLQNLILNGHDNTVISAMRCIEELDAGPIYIKSPLNLAGSAADIFARASAIIGEMIIDIIEFEPNPKPQQGSPVIFRRRSPDDSNLRDANISSLNDIYNFIRMLDAEGYPKAFVKIFDYHIAFFGVRVDGDKLSGSFEIKKCGSKGS
jgi:methionyl-tRNA formyltransferase